MLNAFLKILLSCCVTLVVACSKKDDLPPGPTVPVITPILPTSPQPALKYLALGDSYTIGQGVALTERFPHQTVTRLKQLNRNIADPEYIAATGWTTANLLSAISRENKPKDYDIVSLLIGVNNQYQGRDTAEYRLQFTQCLEQAILHAAGRKQRIFVLSIPDYGVTPFGKSMNPEKIKREIDAFNKINEAVSATFGVNYIEITIGSREAINDITLVASDNLHPSGKEYKKWAEKLSSQILAVLR
jgi:lysophospholipase L1-like esterase